MKWNEKCRITSCRISSYLQVRSSFQARQRECEVTRGLTKFKPSLMPPITWKGLFSKARRMLMEPELKDYKYKDKRKRDLFVSISNSQQAHICKEEQSYPWMPIQTRICMNCGTNGIVLCLAFGKIYGNISGNSWTWNWCRVYACIAVLDQTGGIWVEVSQMQPRRKHHPTF